MINIMRKSNAALDHVDIRALRLLALLLQTRSVTRTAEALGVSQPAASRALALLRDAAGDPLLVRAGAGHALTPRAAALVPQLEAALAAVHGIFRPEGFDPAAARGRVRIATTDYGAVTVGALLAARLAQRAPGLELELLPWSADTFARLAGDGLDLALYADAALPAGLLHQDLFAETYSVLLRRGHPLLRRPAARLGLPPEALAGWPRVVILYPDGRRMRPDDVLQQAGAGAGHVALSTPYFLSAPSVVERTDHIICLPTRAAAYLARHARVAVVGLRAPGTGFVYRQIWHRRAEADEQLRWLRAEVAAAAATVST